MDIPMSALKIEKAENRASPRAKVARKLRVRPSDGDVDHFEEFPLSVNVSKRGVYFHTSLKSYEVGMRLFITYPFTYAEDPMKSEYLAEVVRVETLVAGKFGIAVHLLSAI